MRGCSIFCDKPFRNENVLQKITQKQKLQIRVLFRFSFIADQSNFFFIWSILLFIMNPKTSCHLTPCKKRAVIELRKSGKSARSIAKQLGFHNGSISRQTDRQTERQTERQTGLVGGGRLQGDERGEGEPWQDPTHYTLIIHLILESTIRTSISRTSHSTIALLPSPSSS